MNKSTDINEWMEGSVDSQKERMRNIYNLKNNLQIANKQSAIFSNLFLNIFRSQDAILMLWRN